MKKILLGLFAMCCMALNSQSESYDRLVRVLRETNPALDLNNKIIVVNPWSISGTESRDLNKAFGNAQSTFQVAKLKGGRAGMVVVALNMVDKDPEARITLKKDGTENLILLQSDELKNDPAFQNNKVFDSNGQVIYSGLESAGVFNAIQKLITR